MELRQTETFGKDIKKLDGGFRSRLKKTIEKLARQPGLGKPLKHLKNVFSERVGNFRLVYQIQGDVLLLVCFKNRDHVFEELQKLL